MEQVLNSVLLNLDYLVLMFMRVTALLISSPIFGRRNIPSMAKIGLCLAITYIVFAAAETTEMPVIDNIWTFAFLIMKELMFGLIMGYVTTAFFSLVQTAGYAIDMQMGFGMVNVFDVQNNVNVPITGNFLYIVLTLSFFAVYGHHQLIRLLVATFETVPVGRVAFDPNLGWAALELFTRTFVLAVQVAMPIIATGLLAEILLGFVVRTTPSMNVFVVGIPLKILLGFIMLLLILPAYVRLTSNLFEEMFSAIEYMMRGLVAS